MKKIMNCLVRSVPIATVLILSGYVIVYFIFKDPGKLDFTLFVLGGIPIVIFLPSVFSQSRSGALHTPKVIFRKVETLERKRDEANEAILPALCYVLAGVLTWIYSSIIY